MNKYEFDELLLQYTAEVSQCSAKLALGDDIVSLRPFLTQMNKTGEALSKAFEEAKGEQMDMTEGT